MSRSFTLGLITGVAGIIAFYPDSGTLSARIFVGLAAVFAFGLEMWMCERLRNRFKGRKSQF